MAHKRAVFEAILTGQPYPVTAMISLASNPLLALPNVQRTYAALKALQLYVVMDYYLTPSAALADYVFPAASTVERTELWLTPSFCLACPKGIGPLYERRDDYQFWRGLAVRLGQAEHWPWQTVEEVWDYRLAPAGLTFEELLARNGLFGKREYQRYERFGFGTPSGKVELRSSTFEALGCAPVPVYREPAESPAGDSDLALEYPLVLITGSRFMPMYHSEQRHLAAARAEMPDPRLSLHPDTAAALGLAEGTWAWVVTPQGRIRLRTHLTTALDPRMADVQHGWWFPSARERNRNCSASSIPTPICSAPTERSSVARRSAVGPTRLCFAGWNQWLRRRRDFSVSCQILNCASDNSFKLPGRAPPVALNMTRQVTSEVRSVYYHCSGLCVNCSPVKPA
jgi:anaerobic selenocysteine-containing dehydrogenase